MKIWKKKPSESRILDASIVISPNLGTGPRALGKKSKVVILDFSDLSQMWLQILEHMILDNSSIGRPVLDQDDEIGTINSRVSASKFQTWNNSGILDYSSIGRSGSGQVRILGMIPGSWTIPASGGWHLDKQISQNIFLGLWTCLAAGGAWRGTPTLKNLHHFNSWIYFHLQKCLLQTDRENIGMIWSS